LQTMESAATVILFTRVMKTLLPSKKRDMARLSNEPSNDPWEATTAANASADGPLAVAADADEGPTDCRMVQQSMRAASCPRFDVRDFIHTSSICSI
jgi:hypothetical protein